MSLLYQTKKKSLLSVNTEPGVSFTYVGISAITDLTERRDGSAQYISSPEGMWSNVSGSLNQISAYSTSSIATTDAGTFFVGHSFNDKLYAGTPGSIAPETSGSLLWSGVALSGDGTVAAAPVLSGFVYFRNSESLTWDQMMSQQGWQAVAIARDAKIVFAAGLNSHIYETSNQGVDVVQYSGYSRRNWNKIASSADASIVVAVANSSRVVIRRNFGPWEDNMVLNSTSWYQASVSDDGRVIAVANSSTIFRSLDYGITWQRMDGMGSRAWNKVFVSCDGSRLCGVYDNVVVTITN